MIDLFAGIGTFALRLAESARVSAADSDADAIKALERGAATTSGLKPVDAVQRDLFAIGGRLAAPEPDRLKGPQRAKLAVEPGRIAALERAIDEATVELPPLTAFVLPGGTAKAAALHLARAVSRRAERAVVRLDHVEAVPAEVLVYLNRLSDLLFVLARLANHRAGTPDVTW